MGVRVRAALGLVPLAGCSGGGPATDRPPWYGSTVDGSATNAMAGG
jgi:hypothetical protein